MRVIFRNIPCIILVEDRGDEDVMKGGVPALLYRALRDDTHEKTGAYPRQILEPVAMAQEVWIYKPYTRRFVAFKNKGHINEIIHRMSEHGINVKVWSASLSNGCASEMAFCEDKDEFLFNLKYL